MNKYSIGYGNSRRQNFTAFAPVLETRSQRRYMKSSLRNCLFVLGPQFAKIPIEEEFRGKKIGNVRSSNFVERR